jgi:hypothetical protein
MLINTHHSSNAVMEPENSSSYSQISSTKVSISSLILSSLLNLGSPNHLPTNIVYTNAKYGKEWEDSTNSLAQACEQMSLMNKGEGKVVPVHALNFYMRKWVYSYTHS